MPSQSFTCLSTVFNIRSNGIIKRDIKLSYFIYVFYATQLCSHNFLYTLNNSVITSPSPISIFLLKNGHAEVVITNFLHLVLQITIEVLLENRSEVKMELMYLLQIFYNTIQCLFLFFTAIRVSSSIRISRIC